MGTPLCNPLVHTEAPREGSRLKRQGQVDADLNVPEKDKFMQKNANTVCCRGRVRKESDQGAADLYLSPPIFVHHESGPVDPQDSYRTSPQPMDVSQPHISP